MSKADTTINPARVTEIASDCAGYRLKVEGIRSVFEFAPHKLDSHRTEIEQMLSLLPEEFFDNGGGGWSFLNFCQTSAGVLWTGDHGTCEKLIALAIGLDLADFLLPRDLWDELPGGVPYLVIKRSAFTSKTPTPEATR